MLNISILYFQHFSFWFHLYSTPFPSPQLWSWATRHVPGEFHFWLFQNHMITDKTIWPFGNHCQNQFYCMLGLENILVRVFMRKRNGSYGRSKETLWHCYGFYLFAQVGDGGGGGAGQQQQRGGGEGGVRRRFCPRTQAPILHPDPFPDPVSCIRLDDK